MAPNAQLTLNEAQTAAVAIRSQMYALAGKIKTLNAGHISKSQHDKLDDAAFWLNDAVGAMDQVRRQVATVKILTHVTGCS